jgi:hypothetical protein
MRLSFAVAVLAASLAHLPVWAQDAAPEATREAGQEAAQAADGPTPAAAAGRNVPVHPYTLREDLKAFATWPKEWNGRDWLKFTGVLAAVNVAYRQDDEVHDHYGNPGEPNYHEALDAMPAVMTYGGMWFAAKVARNKEARWEVDAMRRAFVVEAISVQVLKVALRRERPSPGAPKDNWGADNLSMPSGHTAAAFAIGTVLAESGSDTHRALRRSLGYGIGVFTAYQRINHDTHWFSDTVAGAAIGIAAANVVMRRRREAEPFGYLGIAPVDDGMMLTYTVPLR